MARVVLAVDEGVSAVAVYILSDAAALEHHVNPALASRM
jgi:hypothetical protein